MTWLEHHRQSEEFASDADVARLKGDTERARRLYGKAAEAEVRAIDVLDPSKQRTMGITAVSAVALYYKATEFPLAEKTAYRFLSLDDLPNFARIQLRDLLHAIWADHRDTSGIAVVPSDQVNIAMSGDDIAFGSAPIGVVARCVGLVQSILYRVTEFTRDVDHRLTGNPSSDIRAACRPWILHVPTSNYQFAVTIDDTVHQRELFDDDDPRQDNSGPRQIVDGFMSILRASVESPEEKLPLVVQDPDYQNTFLRLARELSPDRSHRLSIWSPRHPQHISLDYATRRRIKVAIDNMARVPTGPREVRGILRAVDLDSRRIVVRDQDDDKHKVDGIDDTMDDLIGAMVNRLVIARTEPTFADKYKTTVVSDKESVAGDNTLELF